MMDFVVEIDPDEPARGYLDEHFGVVGADALVAPLSDVFGVPSGRIEHMVHASLSGETEPARGYGADVSARAVAEVAGTDHMSLTEREKIGLRLEILKRTYSKVLEV